MQFGMSLLKVEGKSITYRYGSDASITLDEEKPFNPTGTGISIQRRDSFTYLQYSDGVKIKWDENLFVYITLDLHYRGKTSGLCGDFSVNSSKKINNKIINFLKE